MTRRESGFFAALLLVISLEGLATTVHEKDVFPHLWSHTPPGKESWVHPAAEARTASDPVIQLAQMKTFFDPPGEYGYYTEGATFGFEHLGIIVSDTLPGAGPPLHQHSVEEAHVVLEGKVRYIIGGKVFTATAPYVVHIPANTPHAFQNISSKPIHVIGILPSNSAEGDVEIGPSPLLPKS